MPAPVRVAREGDDGQFTCVAEDGVLTVGSAAISISRTGGSNSIFHRPLRSLLCTASQLIQPGPAAL